MDKIGNKPEGIEFLELSESFLEKQIGKLLTIQCGKTRLEGTFYKGEGQDYFEFLYYGKQNDPELIKSEVFFHPPYRLPFGTIQVPSFSILRFNRPDSKLYEEKKEILKQAYN